MIGFDNAFKLLPACIQPIFRAKVMSTCGWNVRQWMRKKAGDVRLQKLEREFISKELAQYNIEAETATYINPNDMPKAYMLGIEKRA